jgi:uncharacterized protein YjiS (DUF1127 family)
MTNIALDKNFSVSDVTRTATRRRPALSLVDVAKTALEWRERARQRRRLSQLDDHFLRDIGLTRAEAEEEARKPFWVS